MDRFYQIECSQGEATKRISLARDILSDFAGKLRRYRDMSAKLRVELLERDRWLATMETEIATASDGPDVRNKLNRFYHDYLSQMAV
jgi:hypothetical protein